MSFKFKVGDRVKVRAGADVTLVHLSPKKVQGELTILGDGHMFCWHMVDSEPIPTYKILRDGPSYLPESFLKLSTMCKLCEREHPKPPKPTLKDITGELIDKHLKGCVSCGHFFEGEWDISDPCPNCGKVRGGLYSYSSNPTGWLSYVLSNHGKEDD